jgi:hypothetical protein
MDAACDSNNEKPANARADTPASSSPAAIAMSDKGEAGMLTRPQTPLTDLCRYGERYARIVHLLRSLARA